jgi:hypothetical protein
MYDEETKHLIALLAEAVRASGHSQRWVETEMGVSHGYLSLLFNGKLELKVRHVFMICGALKLDPFDFLFKALAEVRRGRKRTRPTPFQESQRRVEATQAAYEEAPQDFPPLAGITPETVKAILWRELAKVGIFPKEGQEGEEAPLDSSERQEST